MLLELSFIARCDSISLPFFFWPQQDRDAHSRAVFAYSQAVFAQSRAAVHPIREIQYVGLKRLRGWVTLSPTRRITVLDKAVGFNGVVVGWFDPGYSHSKWVCSNTDFLLPKQQTRVVYLLQGTIGHFQAFSAFLILFFLILSCMWLFFCNDIFKIDWLKFI